MEMERLSTSLRISKVRLAFHKTACASFTGWCTYHSATSPRRPIYTRAIRASGSLDSSKSDISDNSSQTDQSSHASIDSSNPETFNSSRPNVKKYSSQRSLILSGSKEVTPEEVNDLMVKAGKPARDLEKWQRALNSSFIVVSARLLSTRKLVGFARATSDHALNGTIWDVVTDPALPNEPLMKRNVVRYILKELRNSVPGCSIALFSSADDRPVFEELDFVADPDGIRGMALFEPPDPHYL